MSASAMPFYTPAQYLEYERETEGRHEYIDGSIYAMAGPSYRHTRITANLARLLGNALADRDCDVTGSDTRVQLTPLGPFFYPDVVVCCGSPQFRDAKADTLLNPLLIAEVLSPSTAQYDRTTKLDQCRRIQSLQEYVLVSQDEARVESYARQSDGIWRQRTFEGLDAAYECESLGVTVPLCEVYRRVDFAPE